MFLGGLFIALLILDKHPHSLENTAIVYAAIILMWGMAALFASLWRSVPKWIGADEPWPPNLNEYPPSLGYLKQLLITSIATAILLYAIHGIRSNDLLVPTKREAMHLHGYAAWVMATCLFFWSVSLFSRVIFHWVGNKARLRSYRTVVSIFNWSAISLFISALVLHLVLH